MGPALLIFLLLSLYSRATLGDDLETFVDGEQTDVI